NRVRPSCGLQHDNAADRLAALQGGEALIDLVERDVARDQFVELEGAVEIGAGQQREVARRPRPAIARPPDALLAHQAAPAPPAPASRAPCTAASPTAPQPITMTVSP